MSSPPVASPHSRRTRALSLVLCTVLVPLAQIGLGYLSFRTTSPWFWLVGTPLAYLLIGGLTALYATGGLSAEQARGRGPQLAVIGCLLGGLVAALLVVAYILFAVHAFQTQPPQPSRAPPGLAIFIIIFFFVPAFLAINLLGVALAPLGGLLGGSFRAGTTGTDWPGDGLSGPHVSSRVWIVIVVVAAILALLVGAVALVLSTGAFSAVG